MKPLLRVVLIVDALMLLGFGALFVLTPWDLLYDSLQLVQTQPALVGIVFGVVLLGLAWLAIHAAFDGALTVAVGRVAGHLGWICGVVMLVWLIGLHRPMLTRFGELVCAGVGAWLIVIGLGGVRLAAAVRQREKVQAAADAAAQREARAAAKQDAKAVARQEARQEPVSYATPVVVTEPAPAMPAPVVTPAPAATPEPAAAPAPSAATEEARHAAATGTPRRPMGG